MAKKNITIDDLANLMQQGFVKAEKDTDKKINDLAVMMQKGFADTVTKNDIKDINKRFEQVDKRLDTKELREMFAA